MTGRFGRARRPAALLLEVVIALMIMTGALGLMAAELVAGLQLTGRADQTTRACELADRLLALLELDPETTQRFFDERETDGDFGDGYRGYFWTATIEPVDLDLEGIGLVTIDILYQEDPQNRDSMEGARVVRRITMLKTEPGRIDLAKDFGMDESQIEELSQVIPIADFDPTAMDPQQLVGLDPQMLLELLPQLMPLLQQFLGSQSGQGGANGPLGQLQSFITGQGGAQQGGNVPFDQLLQGGGGGNLPDLGGDLGGLTIEDLQRMRDQATGGRGGGGAGRAGRGGGGADEDDQSGGPQGGRGRGARGGQR